MGLRDGARRDWRVLLGAICIAQATAIVGFDFTLPFIPLYLQHDLGVHGLGQVALWAGLIGFGPAIPATIFGPLWGRLADRLGYRFMLLRAMTSASVILMAMSLAPSPWILLALRMVQGSLTGTVFASQALVAATVPEKETGRAMGLLQMSVFIGATMGPVGGGAVAQFLGFRAAYVSAGLLLAAATLVVFLFAWEPERHAVRRETAASAPSMGSVLAVPGFAAAVALMLLAQFAGTSVFPIIPLYVQDLLGAGHSVETLTGWLMAATGLASGAGSYLAGRLHRRVGLRPLLACFIAVGSLLIVPQAFVHTYAALLVARCLAGVAFGGVICLVGTLAAVTSPPNAKGTAFGLMGAASSLGFGGGPLIGGILTAAIGMRPVFLVSAAVLGLAPLFLFTLGITAAPLLRRISPRLRLSAEEV